MFRTQPLALSRIAVTAMVISLAGCLEYETTTSVHTDGSFTRSILVKGDSTALFAWNLKIPADPTWTVLERVKVDDKKWSLKAEREFSSGQAWSVWNEGLDRRVLQCSVSVESSFRFFTTSYRFTETIAAYNPFTLIPITDYISPSELDAFLRFEVFKETYPSRGDSLALEDASDRFEEWEVRTRVESYFQTLVSNLDQRAGLDSAQLAGIKEEMAQHFMKQGKKDDFSAEGLRTWARGSREPAVLRAIEAGSDAFEAFKKDIDYINAVGGDSYTSRIEMPGEITKTNGKLEGVRTAVWDNYIAFAYVSDFTMTAESSVVNVWAIVLTLGVIIGIPILVWVAKKMRENR